MPHQDSRRGIPGSESRFADCGSQDTESASNNLNHNTTQQQHDTTTTTIKVHSEASTLLRATAQQGRGGRGQQYDSQNFRPRVLETVVRSCPYARAELALLLLMISFLSNSTWKLWDPHAHTQPQPTTTVIQSLRAGDWTQDPHTSCSHSHRGSCSLSRAPILIQLPLLPMCRNTRTY